MKIFGLLAALTAVGCTKVDTFNCLQSSECMLAGVAGICEPAGICSFPDRACPSGKAFGEFGGDQAGLCVGDSSTTAPTSSSSDTDPITTTGPACASLGGACGDDTPCCGDACTVCQDGMCTALEAAAGPGACGSDCQVCSAGTCAPAPGDQTCPLDCSGFILGAEVILTVTTCHGYDAMPGMGTCGPEGDCSATPTEAGCTTEMPLVLAQCDTVCVQDLGACSPGATGFSEAAFCALDTATEGCKTRCSADGNSRDVATCDGDGSCQHELESCGVYKCDPDTGLCRTKCVINEHCVSNTCPANKKCQ